MTKVINRFQFDNTYIVCVEHISAVHLHKPPFSGYLMYFSMTFGERVLALRKKNKWSQGDLAKKVGTSAPIIGRYERNEIKPSIETAKNIADALGVTIDYLIGGSDTMVMDKSLLKRMKDIQRLKEDEKSHVFALLDAFLKQSKLQSIM